MPQLYHENDTPWGYGVSGSAGTSQVPELRDDVAADGLEVGRDVVVAKAEDHVLGAGIGELAESVDDLRRGLAAEVDVLERRALDLVGVAADRGAVVGEDRVLAGDALGCQRTMTSPGTNKGAGGAFCSIKRRTTSGGRSWACATTAPSVNTTRATVALTIPIFIVASFFCRYNLRLYEGWVERFAFCIYSCRCF